MKASAVRYLLDAGPLVGALSRHDQWHEWCALVIATLDEPVFTTEIVFGEVCHLLKAERAALRVAIRQVTRGRLVLVPIWAAHGARADELLAQYPQMDAGDASLVVLSEQHPRARIITVDARHFTIYRRFRHEPLPLIHPPASP